MPNLTARYGGHFRSTFRTSSFTCVVLFGKYFQQMMSLMARSSTVLFVKYFLANDEPDGLFYKSKAGCCKL